MYSPLISIIFFHIFHTLNFTFFLTLNVANFLDIFPFLISQISILPISLIFSKFIFFTFSILPVFLIFSNYISFTFPILPIFLLFSNFIFSKVPIFLTFPDFLFPSFHTFNFFNSHSLSLSLSHTNSFFPILSFHTSFHLNLQFSQIPPHFYLTLQFSQICRSSSVSVQLCPLHFTSQLYTFFPLSPFFNFFPALAIPCNVPFVVSYLFSPILLVPYTSYFISLNYSFFRYFFSFKDLLFTVPRS